MRAYCDPLTNSFLSFDFVDCKLNRPSNLEYPSIVYEFILHIPISPIVPSVVGIVHRYAMYNALPEGLPYEQWNHHRNTHGPDVVDGDQNLCGK